LEEASMAGGRTTQRGDAAYRHIKALITDAHLDLTKTLEEWKPEYGKLKAKLKEFEGRWLDPRTGRVARLKEQSWFTEIRSKEQKQLASIVSRTVKDLLKYYRTARKILDRRSP
jgi:hypothetical protein